LGADAADESAKVLVFLVNTDRLNETTSVPCERRRYVRLDVMLREKGSEKRRVTEPLGTTPAKFLEALPMDFRKQCMWSSSGWVLVRW
jgi:hypothetical protein